MENFYSGEAVVEAIKEMQKFGDIPQTGKLDNATVQVNLTKLAAKNRFNIIHSTVIPQTEMRSVRRSTQQ